jgi:WXG100 family type VII secretion target
MATIKVNSTVMRDKASGFKTVSSSIKTFTSEMTNEIDSLKSTWEGESAETLVNKFKGLSDDFEEICNTINQYAEFLETAAESYDKVEASVTQGAESQKS